MDMYGHQRMQTEARHRGDVNTRRRFQAHQTAMNRMSGDPRWATRRGVYRPGRDGQEGSGGAAPTMGEAPELNLPEYDERKVSALTQKKSASGVRRLRETTQRAMDQSYDNPNVKKMTVRDALAGYGTGLESVMSGASNAAAQQYGQQYSASVNAEMARFDAANRQQMQAFDISSKAWLMERQYELEDEYSNDPYDAFEEFYG